MILKLLRNKKTTKKILIALLILILPAFILWGVGSIKNRPTVIGIIENKKINTNALEKSIKGIKVQILFSHFNNFNFFSQIMKNKYIINSMAWERLILLNAAKKIKNKVIDKDVISFISRFPLFQKNNTFDQKTYEYIIKNSLAIMPREFEEIIRENLLIEKFKQEITKNEIIEEKEILEYYKKENIKIDLSYISIDTKDFQTINISTEKAEAYYNKNKNDFIDPEKIDIEYLSIPYNNIKEKNKKIHLINNINKKITENNLNFSDIAKQYNITYNQTGFFSKKDIIPEIGYIKNFHDIAFNLKKGETSIPIFSESKENKGTIYLIRKINEKKEKINSFKETKDSIIAKLTNEQKLSLANEKATTFYAKLSNKKITLEQAAKELEQEIKQIKNITINDNTSELGYIKNLISETSNIKENNFIKPKTLKDKIIIIQITKIHPIDETDFDIKKTEIENKLLITKQNKTLENWLKKEYKKTKILVPLNDL